MTAPSFAGSREAPTTAIPRGANRRRAGSRAAPSTGALTRSVRPDSTAVSATSGREGGVDLLDQQAHRAVLEPRRLA